MFALNNGLRIAAVVSALGALLTWMLIADNLPGNYALGIAQRIQVGSMSLWLIALAVQIWVAQRAISGDGRRRARPPAPRSPA